MSPDWQQISDEYGPLVWRVVFRILRSHPESLDCYQDVMLEAFQESQRETIRNWPGFLRWIAVRRGLDRLRQRKRTDRLVDDSLDIGIVSGDEKTPSSSQEMQELEERLRFELTKLPEQQAQAFWLRFIEQLSYIEIAAQMEIDENSVGVLIHRARIRVRNALSDLNQCHQ